MKSVRPTRLTIPSGTSWHIMDQSAARMRRTDDRLALHAEVNDGLSGRKRHKHSSIAAWRKSRKPLKNRKKNDSFQRSQQIQSKSNLQIPPEIQSISQLVLLKTICCKETWNIFEPWNKGTKLILTWQDETVASWERLQVPHAAVKVTCLTRSALPTCCSPYRSPVKMSPYEASIALPKRSRVWIWTFHQYTWHKRGRNYRRIV